jgi:hypothetical protein
MLVHYFFTLDLDGGTVYSRAMATASGRSWGRRVPVEGGCVGRGLEGGGGATERGRRKTEGGAREGATGEGLRKKSGRARCGGRRRYGGERGVCVVGGERRRAPVGFLEALVAREVAPWPSDGGVLGGRVGSGPHDFRKSF